MLSRAGLARSALCLPIVSFRHDAYARCLGALFRHAARARCLVAPQIQFAFDNKQHVVKRTRQQASCMQVRGLHKTDDKAGWAQQRSAKAKATDRESHYGSQHPTLKQSREVDILGCFLSQIRACAFVMIDGNQRKLFQEHAWCLN